MAKGKDAETAKNIGEIAYALLPNFFARPAGLSVILLNKTCGGIIVGDMATDAGANKNRNDINHMVPDWFVNFLTGALVFVFLVGGIYTGYVFYHAVKDLVAHAEFPTLPYIDLTLPVVGDQTPRGPVEFIEGQEEFIPITGISGEPLPDWEQKERVTILLMGIDRRPDETYSRTDTMILATIDPSGKTAGMLSIPRDLWVTVPGYGEYRINQAHYLGEKNKYPGGGPALAMKTLQYNLGVPIHFYVKVDFDGFRRIVDTLGGIDVDVPYTIDDPTYPDENYGYDPFYIEAGPQHLDGEDALKYARTRHTAGADFARSERQQQVLLAIREKALQLNIVPKIPELWDTMGDSVETDLQLVDILELAKLADDIKAEDIETAVIDQNMTVDYITDQGAQVLLPIRDKIRPVVESMFYTSAVAPAATATAENIPEIETQLEEIRQQMAEQAQQQEVIKQYLQQDNATVVVQNGTTREGLASETAVYLRQRGFNVVQFGAGDSTNYEHTVIIFYTDKTYTIEVLKHIFNVSDENVRRGTDLKSEVDIRVIIGADFELPAASTIVE